MNKTMDGLEHIYAGESDLGSLHCTLSWRLFSDGGGLIMMGREVHRVSVKDDGSFLDPIQYRECVLHPKPLVN